MSVRNHWSQMSRGMRRAARLQRIEELLLVTPGGCTVQELAATFHVHRTTIWRDLSELSCEIPVQKIGNRYLIDRRDYLTNTRFSHSESMILYLVLRRVIGCQSNISPVLISALEKLTLALRQPSAEWLSKAIQTTQGEQSADQGRTRIWEPLVQAWVRQITVHIAYQDSPNRSPNTYEVQPYLFEPSLSSNAVYLVGYNLTHNALQMFEVDRIARVVVTANTFARPDCATIGKMLRSIWQNGQLDNVQLRPRKTVLAHHVRSAA